MQWCLRDMNAIADGKDEKSYGASHGISGANALLSANSYSKWKKLRPPPVNAVAKLRWQSPRTVTGSKCLFLALTI